MKTTIKYLMAAAILMLGFSANAQKVNKLKGDSFGDGISASKYISYDALMKELSTNDTVQATVKTTVDEVCQVKGCWMTLEDDGSGNAMMVKFKDYGFFVPKDIGGKEVVVEGKAYSTVIPVDELRHYAEDAGKSKEEIAKITEPERKYAFLATGVLVVN